MLVPVPHLNRHRRTRQVHLQVQHQSEVTNPHQETDKNKKKDINRASDDRLRLRFGTSCNGGIQEAQYLYSLPKKTDIAKYAFEPR